MKRVLTAVLLSVAVCLLGTGFALAQGYNLDEYEKIAGKKMGKFSEAPMLRTRVAAGELPPVEERLPENPFVMEPWEEVGKYGGTLNWCEFTIDYDHYLRHFNEVRPVEIAPSSTYNVRTFVGGKILPAGVFEDWKISDDARTVTFRIRKGLKWSDGVPVTTEDVRYTIEDVVMNKEITPILPEWAKWGGEPVKLEVVDDYTFRLRFAKSYGLFVPKMVDWNYGYLVRPKHYLKQFHTKYTSMEKLEPVMEEKGYKKDEWGKFYSFMDIGAHAASFIPTRSPICMECPSLHPWRVVSEPNPGEFILERNPYFYKVDTEGNQLPYIDRLHRSYVTDLEMENMKILAGETDVQFQFLRLTDYPLFKRNEEKGGYNVMPLKAWQDQMLMYIFNLCPKDPVLREIIQDVRFRRALSLALDREQIKESIFLGFGRPAQIAPLPGSPCYEEKFEKAYTEYDVERANSLLDEMGLKWDENRQYRLRPDGKRLTLPIIYYEVTPTATPGAELASEYWRAIGVHVPVKQVNGQYYWKLYNANETIACVWWLDGANVTFGWIAKFNPTTPMWVQWYNTDGEKGVEPLPVAKKVYELSDEYWSVPSDEERIKAEKEIWRLQAENLWCIGTVVETPIPFVYSKKLGNISVAGERNYYTITVGEASEQWFFKK